MKNKKGEGYVSTCVMIVVICITVTYFVADQKKAGGAYVDYTGIIKRIDEYERKVLFVDKTSIPIDDIYAIEGEIYKGME